MKTIELEVFQTAMGIEMEEDDLVIIYSTENDDEYRVVGYWDSERKLCLDLVTNQPIKYKGKMTGWSIVPWFYDHSS